MKTLNKIPIKVVELEISIKLLEYLKRTSTIDNEMYNYVISKLIKKGKNDNYKILT